MTDKTLDIAKPMNNIDGRLQITPPPPLGVVLHDVNTTRVTRTITADSSTEIRATTHLFGRASMPVTGAVLESGEEFLSIPFEKSGFTFDQIFTDFSSPELELFIFDEVNIHISTSDEPDTAYRIDFSGRLRIDSAPLSDVAKALNIVEAPLLTGSIVTDDSDLSDKVIPQAMTLESAATLEVEIIPGATLSQAALTVTIVPAADDNKWQINAGAKGELELVNLADDIVTMPCLVNYSNEKFFLNASMKNASGLFGVDAITLDYIELDTVIGQEKAININSAFTVEGKQYHLGGMLTTNKAGIYMRGSSLSIQDFISIVNAVSNAEFALPEYDLSVSNLLLGFATAEGQYKDHTLSQGITLSTDLTVLDFECEMSANVSQTVVQFEGSLDDVAIGPVTINKAGLSLALYRKAENKSAEFSLTGDADIENVNVQCKVSYLKQDNKWQSLLYAEINAETLSIGTVIPEAKNSFLDSFQFTKAAFIYSSFNATKQDEEFAITIKKGLQLIGKMKQVPALSALTGVTDEDGLDLVLYAQFGTTTAMGISLPDTQLNLGPSVKTSPINIALEIVPEPAVELVCGMDLTVPKQADPLHFDLNLSVGVLKASGGGTMKNYWENPFGVQGLKIGPNLALELGIIYLQGTPSTFGFVGGLALGDVVAQMAMSISVDPRDQILMGKLEKLSPNNLVSFVNDVTSAGIPSDAVPNFFNLKNLEIYIAPVGGSIGTVQFEPGFSFAGSLVMFDKEVELYARLSDQGIEAEGRIDKIDLGPLTIQGKQGGEAEFDLEMTISKQSILIDGEIDFVGSSVGIFADLSSRGIEFNFERSFLGLANYLVEGKSEGDVIHPESLDFALRAEFSSTITTYLKDNLSDRISVVTQAVNKSLSEAQAEVARAENAYRTEFNKADIELKRAKLEANKLVAQLNGELRTARNNYAADMKAANQAVSDAKNAYDSALNSARRDVVRAQGSYESALRSAQADIDRTKRDYEGALSAAQRDVDRARANYNNAIASAQRSLNAAKQKVNSLQSNINLANRKLRKEKRKTLPNPFNLAKLVAEIAGLETAKATANFAIDAAKTVMRGATKGAEYAAFTGANAALEAVKQGGKYMAFENAKLVLEGVKRGGKYTAFESAKAVLSSVQKGSEYTVWQAAQRSLDGIDIAGKAAISAAQQNVNSVSKTAVFVAFKSAEMGLEAVKQGSSFIAFQTAQATLEAVKQGAGAGLSLAQYVASHAGDLIDVRSVALSAQLKAIQKGELFVAEVDMSILGTRYNTTIDFDAQDAGHFIELLFNDALKEAELIAKNLG